MIFTCKDLSGKLYKMWKSELGFGFAERKGGKIVILLHLCYPKRRKQNTKNSNKLAAYAKGYCQKTEILPKMGLQSGESNGKQKLLKDPQRSIVSLLTSSSFHSLFPELGQWVSQHLNLTSIILQR